MKIDLGESLLASWLKYIKGCQVTQLNWKFNSVVDKKKLSELSDFYSNLQAKYNITSGLTQLLRQSEIDVVGIKIDEGETSQFNLFAVEVAFHEAGLNYGNNEERIAKKLIRAALSIYFSTGVKSGEIIFATPSLRSNQCDLEEICENLSKVFNDKGFGYEFKLYVNDTFLNDIVEELNKKISAIKDTSDLFIRAIKLLNVSKSFNIIEVDETNEVEDIDSYSIEENISIYNKDNLSHILGLKNLGIGKKAMQFFKVLENQNSLNTVMEQSYKLSRFDLFKIEDLVNSDHQLSGRYYKSHKFKIGNEYYLLCNHWYDKDESLLYKIAELVD